MDLWLTEETSRYMFRLLAVKEVFGNPQRFGFLLKREHLYPGIPYKEVAVDTEISDLSNFAQNKASPMHNFAMPTPGFEVHH